MTNAEAIMYRDFREMAGLLLSDSPTHKVFKHCTRGGFEHGTPILNAQERKAQAVWSFIRANRVLNEEEAMYAVSLFGGFSLLQNEMGSLIENKLLSGCRGVPRDEIDAVLEYTFISKKYPKIESLQDKFNWSKGQAWRRQKRIGKILAELHNRVLPKLELALVAETHEV